MDMNSTRSSLKSPHIHINEQEDNDGYKRLCNRKQLLKDHI